MPKLCVLDFETYYDREYSLSKMTTEAYIKDERFQAIGVAMKFDDGPIVWYAGPENVERVMRETDWEDVMVVCQNTAFDGAIMKWYYDASPLAWCDTMGMSRALFPHEKSHSLKSQAERMGVGVKGEEVLNALGLYYQDFSEAQLLRYGEYCRNDVELTHKLFKMYLGMGFPKVELKLIDLTLRMFIEPALRLDRELLESHLKDVKKRKNDLLEEVRDVMLGDNPDVDFVYTIFSQGTDGIKKLLMSNEKFADALRYLGVTPPMKTSPTTGKQAYAFAKTDEAFQALADHPLESVQALVAARLGNKTTLEETRTERFIDMASRGSFPVPLRYYGAHSGRWSGQDSINLQNLPSRGPNAGKIKRAILAPKGHVVIDCDSAQIEARTLAWLAGQQDLVEAFERKEDVYKLMASKIYGVPVDQIDKQQRQVGKTVVLGAGYGVGHVKLQGFLKTQAGVEVSLDEAKRIISTYRSASYRIAELWEKSGKALNNLMQGYASDIDAVGLIKAVPDKGITLPNGLFIQYPNLRSVVNDDGKSEIVYTSKGLPVRIYGGKCLAADTEVLTNRGWVRITNVAPDDRLWDGVTWVSHMGLTYQGVKPTIVLDGVRMTTDHLVLTTDGWVNASSCEGLHRPDIRMPDGNEVRGGRAPLYLGVPLSVWHSGDAGSDRRGEVREAWGHPLMRVYGGKESPDPCYEQAPGVLGMAVYARPMQTAFASSMAQLRRAWDHGVYAMGAVLRGILGRHGADIQARANARPHRQQRPIQPGELPMGVVQSAGWESSRGAPGGYVTRRTDNGGTTLNPAVPMAQEAVYDIINAGPRTRFVVRGATGPMIVHNCVENFTQAVARCVVAEQALRIAKRYKVVLTVHDAVAIVAKESEAKEAQAYVEECMSWNPKWAVGLPLACESGMGASYGDC